MPATDEPALTEVAELCVKARQALGSGGSQMLRLLLDMALLELSKDFAAAETEKHESGSAAPPR